MARTNERNRFLTKTDIIIKLNTNPKYLLILCPDTSDFLMPNGIIDRTQYDACVFQEFKTLEEAHSWYALLGRNKRLQQYVD